MDLSDKLRARCLPPGATTDAILRVANRVRDAGGRAWLVGGCVRDALLGLTAKDFDLEVCGVAPDRLLALLEADFALNTVGASFGVIKLSGYNIDVALPRRESKAAPGHRGFLVHAVPDLAPREACARRDFTINAILLDPLTGEINDPWNGQRDLAAGILRHVGPAFREDPLRVLRAMQFAARFSLSVDPETVAVCRTMRPDNLPRERLAAEWEKMLLKGVKPSLGLAFLRDCAWIKAYPELAALVDCPQYPKWHPEGDVWTHTLHAVDALPGVRTGHAADDRLVAVAVLCHDLGKPETTARQPDGRITAHRHEVTGGRHVRAFVNRLWNEPRFTESVVRLVRAHMRPLLLVTQDASDKAFRRLAVDVGRMDLLAAVVECDMRATPPNPPPLEILATFRERAQALSVSRDPPKPILMGRHLIARGLTPGPDFGRLLKRGYEAQLDGAFSDEASACAFLDRLLDRPYSVRAGAVASPVSSRR